MSATTMLKGHELYRSMGFEDVDRINSFSSIKEMSADEFVFKSGTGGSHVYVLLDGRIKLRSSAASAETGLTVGFIEKGEFFGLSPLLGRGHHLVAAQCAVPSKVLAIEATPLREMLKANSLVGFRFMNQLARAYFMRYIETLKRVQNVIREVAAI